MESLNYKEFGEGEATLILHGVFGMLDNWQSFAKRLAENYNVFIIDQRNHGKSFHSDAFSYELMAEDLKKFMDEHSLDRAHIIGHSMGGKTAMQFAFTYPERLNKLIVIDIAPKQYMPGHLEIFHALFDLDLESIESRKEAADALADQIPSQAVRQFLLKNLSRNKEGSYHLKMNLPVIYQNYDKIIEALESDVPYEGETLFVKGGYSPYIQEEDSELIEQLFPNSNVFEIEQSGHWVHAQKPQELFELISGYLESNIGYI